MYAIRSYYAHREAVLDHLFGERVDLAALAFELVGDERLRLAHGAADDVRVEIVGRLGQHRTRQILGDRDHAVLDQAVARHSYNFV